MAILSSSISEKDQGACAIWKALWKQSARLCLLVFCLARMALLPVQAQSGVAEYKIKAVFLFNFVQFVEWPSSAFSSSDDPFVIGVLGADPFGTVLDETVQNETVKGRPIQVKRFKSVPDVQKCQILFISNSESDHLAEILSELRGRPILTVGESDGFSQSGGIIRFFTQNQKMRIRVNIDSATEAKLTISSKLLRLAEVVHAKPTR